MLLALKPLMAFLFILLSDLFAVWISLGLTVFVFSFLSYCVCPVGVIGFLGIFAASEENKHEEQMAKFRENCAKEKEQKGKAKKRRKEKKKRRKKKGKTNKKENRGNIKAELRIQSFLSGEKDDKQRF